jgi:hypothetical protein
VRWQNGFASREQPSANGVNDFAGPPGRLLDAPRPGAPRSITDAQMEEVVTKTLESMPVTGTHWTTRLMAQKTDLSQSAIVRIGALSDCQPHRVDNFKFSKDQQFVENVRDIVGLYLNPPDRRIILCVDGKSQVPALNRPSRFA